ncbi:ATP-grasp domain-containing protein [Azospirillum sp.]|uniref:ATP-grasp domain-containing protein n=1 Tax=Azospirillum sp. TaxID=34012 RepID=UPI003D71EA0F
MPRLLLLIESNTSGTGRLFARTARDLGLEPVLIGRQPDRYPYVAEDGIRAIISDTANLDALRSLVRTLDLGEGVAGITSSSEYFIATAARLAGELGLPGPDPDAVTACRNKATQRRRLAETGVDWVRHAEVSDPGDAVQAADAIGLPVVLKPVAGSGSFGVRLCATLADVATHARQLLADGAGALLVEEAVRGAEYSVEIFHDAVVGVTRKHLGALPHFVEMGHDFPAPLAPAETERLAGFALAATRALGLTWGPLHVEMRLDGDRPHIMEVNPRLAGGFIPELVRHATGIDLIQATVQLAVGEVPDVAATRREHAAIRFLVPSGDGLWVATEGLEAARGAPYLRDLRLYRAPPLPVVRRGDFQDRLGHVLTCAPRMESAVGAAELARTAIRFRIASDGAGLLATVA